VERSGFHDLWDGEANENGCRMPTFGLVLGNTAAGKSSESCPRLPPREGEDPGEFRARSSSARAQSSEHDDVLPLVTASYGLPASSLDAKATLLERTDGAVVAAQYESLDPMKAQLAEPEGANCPDCLGAQAFPPPPPADPDSELGATVDSVPPNQADLADGTTQFLRNNGKRVAGPRALFSGNPEDERSSPLDPHTSGKHSSYLRIPQDRGKGFTVPDSQRSELKTRRRQSKGLGEHHTHLTVSAIIGVST